jgi:hypothetical protein
LIGHPIAVSRLISRQIGGLCARKVNGSLILITTNGDQKLLVFSGGYDVVGRG